ncbi:MAG: glycosyltransferase [FCB group bacterium]|jgi:glycosyltransferase involved in cell wall biosynthesis|nr:glycosyltransferase [FCB group bacterium]
MPEESQLNVAYLAPEFGAVTSTFIYREIEALESLGARVDTYSTRRPSESLVSAEAVPLIERTTYLYDLSKSQVLLDAGAMKFGSPLRYFQTATKLLHDVFAAKVPTPADRAKLVWHFLVACSLARRLVARKTQHLHAHFAHVPTSIAMYAAGLAGIPYSFTAHANDIFERPTALREKVARSGFGACISEYNRRHLSDIGCAPAKLDIVRCALDVENYDYRDPKPPGDPPMLYSVGRLVEKKGIGILIEALKHLRDRGVAFQCRIVGNGPLTDALAAQVRELGLQDRVNLAGGQPQERVKEWFREADVFVLPCVVAASGDRDGIPVVLMEAMALGVPVVTTAVSGIPELVEAERSGLVVPPGDALALADALERLLGDPELARRLAREARTTLETTFESRRNAGILWRKMHECARSTS